MVSRRNGGGLTTETAMPAGEPRDELLSSSYALDNVGELVEVTPPEPEPLDPYAEPEPDEIESAADRLVRIMSELSAAGGAKSVVQVFRVGLPGGRTKIGAYCADYTPEEFEAGGRLKLIREHWGPGEYEIRVYGANPRNLGRFSCRARETVVIAEALAGPEAAKMPAGGNPHPNSGIGQAMQALTEQNDRLTRMLGERPDPSKAFLENVALFRQLKELLAPPPGVVVAPTSQLSQLKELAESMRAMRELSGEFGPPKEEGDGLMQMAGPIVELIKTSMQAKQAEAAGAPLPVIQAPRFLAAQPPAMIPAAAPAPTEAAAPVEGVEGAEDVEEDEGPVLSDEARIALLKSYLAAMIGMASSKLPAEFGANLIVATFPDDAIELMRAPVWWTAVAQLMPEAMPFEAWFTDARALALAEIERLDAEDAAAAA